MKKLKKGNKRYLDILSFLYSILVFLIIFLLFSSSIIARNINEYNENISIVEQQRSNN